MPDNKQQSAEGSRGRGRAVAGDKLTGDATLGDTVKRHRQVWNAVAFDLKQQQQQEEEKKEKERESGGKNKNDDAARVEDAS